MTKNRDEPLSFNWTVDTYNIDFDLFELQLHSLCKPKNIGFNADLYLEELKQKKYITDPLESTAIRLALISFVKSLNHVLTSFGIKLELPWKEVLKYGNHELKTRNLASTHVITFALKSGINAKVIIADNSEKARALIKKKINNAKKNNNVVLIRNGKRSIKVIPETNNGRSKVLPFRKQKSKIAKKKKSESSIFKNKHLTTGAICKSVQKDLIKFERSVIESITRQFKNEMEKVINLNE